MPNCQMTRRSFMAALGLGTLSLAACSDGKVAGSAGTTAANTNTKVEIVFSSGGVDDNSFNEMLWSGMRQLEQKNGWDISYLESHQEADYVANLEQAVKDGSQLVWAISSAMSAATAEVAVKNPDVYFALIDAPNEAAISNVTGVLFRDEQCSFVVGYIAARVSTTGMVGFVGGVDSERAQAFAQGYYAGIAYACKKHNLIVAHQGQMAGSFGDATKGKILAQKMVEDGCDVVFHAAGSTGRGVIEGCAEAGVWAIGADRDQSDLAPDTVITSVLKRSDQAIVRVSQQLMSGKLQGGTTVTLGIAEDAVGIAPTHDLLDTIDPNLYGDALNLLDTIKKGDIIVPTDVDELNAFVATL